MKLLTMLIIFGFSIYSCTKSPTFSEPKNNPAVVQVLNENDVTLQKSMYRMLTPSEKFFNWDNKYASLLSSNTLNKNQKDFITRFKNT